MMIHVGLGVVSEVLLSEGQDKEIKTQGYQEEWDGEDQGRWRGGGGGDPKWKGKIAEPRFTQIVGKRKGSRDREGDDWGEC